jgi:hypothetical protein
MSSELLAYVQAPSLGLLRLPQVLLPWFGRAADPERSDIGEVARSLAPLGEVAGVAGTSTVDLDSWGSIFSTDGGGDDVLE